MEEKLIFVEEHKTLVEEDKGYEYIGSKKRNKGNSKYKVWHIIVKHKRCEKISSMRLDTWKKGSRPHIGNDYCCCAYEESLAYYIEVELGLNLDGVWNWELNNKNGINPYHIKKCSSKKVWLYCQENDYHNYDREGNKVGYEAKCSDFYNKKGCPFESNHKTHWKDSLAYNYPKVARMISEVPKNKTSFEDCYSISCGNGRSFYFKCLDCGEISKDKLTIHQIVKYGYSCKYCTDNVSIPNKMLREISKQLRLNLNFEYSPKWLNNKRLDGYDENFKIAVEMDGEYNNNHKGKRKEVDDWKDDECLKHGIYVIRIDLMDNKEYRNNTLNYIKRQILNSPLNQIYNLSNIDWKLAWEESQKSKCIEAWKLYNNGIHDTKKIAETLNLDRSTVIRYLNKGRECGKCNYTKHKYIICVTTNKIFKKVYEGADFYNIDRHGISDCCNGKRDYYGKLEDGTKLVWKKLKDWKYDNIKTLTYNHNKILRGKDISKLHSKINQEVA